VNPSSTRLLAVRLSSLGDLVHTLPVLPVLRGLFPDAQLDWLVDSRWSPLMKLVRGIDEVIPLESSFSGYSKCIKRVRRARYSCFIDFQGIYRSAVFGWISGAERRIGRDRNSARERGAAKFYTECVVPSGSHVAEMSVSRALQLGGKMPSQLTFPIEAPPQERLKIRKRLGYGKEEYVVISPGGGWKSKCWPPERFAKVSAELWRRHRMPIVINVAPGEEQLGQAVAVDSLPAKPVVLCPELPELAALMSEARLVVGGDTGPVHLAAALGSPVIALFGPTNAARNGPLPHGIVLQNASVELPNYQRGDYARGRVYSAEMLSITVDQALSAIEHEITRASLAHSSGDS
jgi:heptosyltransferase-1